MVRDTSILTYHQVLEEGLLAEREIEVYKAIKTLGNPTDQEISQHLGYVDPNKVRPSRKSLLDQGVIIEVEKRNCQVTGRTAWTWTVPDVAHYRAKPAMTKCPHCAGKGKIAAGPVQAVLKQRTVGTGYCSCGRPILVSESACKFCSALESLKATESLIIKRPTAEARISDVIGRSV